MTVDYAETISNLNESSLAKNVPSGAIVTNNSTINAVNSRASVIVPKTSDRVYSKYPLVTITARPSCGCGYGYWWHTRTFISYCPHCHRYGTLANVHKYPARYEQELTCRHCGADYCGVCGKEKYSWSRYYLRKC